MNARLAASERRLAARGFPVFPCRVRGKTPLTPRGCLDATTDITIISRWRAKWPEANVAIATGGRSRLLVVDIDGDEGEASLRSLEAEHGPMPASVEVITGGGGRHIYLRMPDGGALSISAGKLGAGIDTRGSGGYVLAPPSRHPSGREYVWSVDCADAIADAPAWLIEKLAAPTNGHTATDPETWRKIIGDGVEEGQRNATLTRIAGLLFRRLDPLVAAELAVCWNIAKCRPPLPPEEVKRILNSVAAREMKRRGAQ
jgi:Bifunctional DNA primase/polymerase, N-terminal/Primase C terminal 1 (PriCT-1)